MQISIIIVSWSVRDLLKKCLESLFAHNQGVDFEVIVVDNASADGTVEMVKQNFPQVHPVKSAEGGMAEPLFNRVKLIASDKNLGFAKGNNLGIRQAKGEYVLLLNPDTEFVENSLEKVISKIKSDPAIGVLGCRLLNSDRTLQASVRKFPRLTDIFVMLFKLHKIFPSLLDRYLEKDFFAKIFLANPHPTLSLGGRGELYEVDQVMGAFFLVPVEVFNKIGLLDEGYFIWFEEVDFCRRAKKAGYKILYYPGTSIIHHGGQSFSQQMTLKKQWWFFRSASRYFLKQIS